MKTLHVKILTLTLILSIGVFTSGCLLKLARGGNVSSEVQDDKVTLIVGFDVFDCSELMNQNFIIRLLCIYTILEQDIDSELDLSFTDFFLLRFLDPIIAQVPAGATNITGTFTGGGTGGNLDIQAGFTTIPADINNNITAEPGMQLVILDFPGPQPVLPAAFEVNINFDLPPGAGPVEVKAMAAGKVPTEEGTFYPPIFPCKNDFADIPSVTIPESPTLQDLDLSDYLSEPGCEGLVYDYSGLTPIVPVRPIPTLSEWGLIAMAGVLGIIGLLALRRRNLTT